MQINNYVSDFQILILFNLPLKQYFWLSLIQAAATIASVSTTLYPVMTNNHQATLMTSPGSETVVIDFDWYEIKPDSPEGKLEIKSCFIPREKHFYCYTEELNYEG